MKAEISVNPETAGFDQETKWPSNVLIVGSSGFGKSTKLRERCEYSFEQGRVCIDLYDAGRLENSFYALKNPYTGIYQSYKWKWDTMCPNNNVTVPIPKEFPTEVLFPAVSGIDEDLPDIFTPFRIPIDDMTIDELHILLGGHITERGRSLLETAWLTLQLGGNISLEGLISTVLDYATKGYAVFNETKVPMANMTIATPLLRSLAELQRLNILCTTKDEYALNLDKVMRDKSKIHSFTMRYMPRLEYRYLLYGWICSKLHSLRLKNNYPELALFIREMHNLAPAKALYEGQAISRKYIVDLASEGRDLLMRIYFDTQYFNKIHLELRRNPQVYHIFHMEIGDLLETNKRFKFEPSVLHATAGYPIGMCTSKNWKQRSPECFMLYEPPRSWIKKPKDDFISIWKKQGRGIKHFCFGYPPPLFTITSVIDDDEGGQGKSETEKHKQMIVRILSIHGELGAKEILRYFDFTPQYISELLRVMRKDAGDYRVIMRQSKKDKRISLYSLPQ